MEARAPQLERGNAVILAVACLAITLCSMSCGGAGSTEVVLAPTPGFSLSSTTLNFANQCIGSTSTPESVTLTNVGNAALTLSSVQVTDSNASDFSQTNTCGSSVAANDMCTIGVTFTPSLASTESASVTITDNASGSPQTVGLLGTGAHDVILSWAASGTSGVLGYNVYRGTTSGGESSAPLNSTPINGTTYVDANVTAGATYYYAVTAVGSDGVQSAASGETEASVP